MIAQRRAEPRVPLAQVEKELAIAEKNERRRVGRVPAKVSRRK